MTRSSLQPLVDSRRAAVATSRLAKRRLPSAGSAESRTLPVSSNASAIASRRAACSGIASKRLGSTFSPADPEAAPVYLSAASSAAELPALSVRSKLEAASSDSPTPTIDSPSSSPPFWA